MGQCLSQPGQESKGADGKASKSAGMDQAAKKDQQAVYVINGFYMSMREKFTKPGTSIYYYAVEWDSSTLSWGDFRGKILGATDPSAAAAGSIRRMILDDYKDLGLAAEPNVGDNGVHGSASPFEGMVERCNWLETKVEEDDFGKELIDKAGVDAGVVATWLKDPQVDVEGKKASLFDSLEDINTAECLNQCSKIAGNGDYKGETATNRAFVFIKPHANNPKVKTLVEARFKALGFTVTKQGELTAEVIDEKKLIDNHYYAIANKATLSKPSELNPPDAKKDEFKAKFGLPWEKALKDGVVYNAMDGKEKLGLEVSDFTALWDKSKQTGNLLKFGGGFYCGKINVLSIDKNGEIILLDMDEPKGKASEKMVERLSQSNEVDPKALQAKQDKAAENRKALAEAESKKHEKEAKKGEKVKENIATEKAKADAKAAATDKAIKAKQDKAAEKRKALAEAESKKQEKEAKKVGKAKENAATEKAKADAEKAAKEKGTVGGDKIGR